MKQTLLFSFLFSSLLNRPPLRALLPISATALTQTTPSARATGRSTTSRRSNRRMAIRKFNFVYCARVSARTHTHDTMLHSFQTCRRLLIGSSVVGDAHQMHNAIRHVLLYDIAHTYHSLTFHVCSSALALNALQIISVAGTSLVQTPTTNTCSTSR